VPVRRTGADWCNSQFVNSRYYTNPRLFGARARVSF